MAAVFTIRSNTNSPHKGVSKHSTLKTSSSSRHAGYQGGGCETRLVGRKHLLVGLCWHFRATCGPIPSRSTSTENVQKSRTMGMFRGRISACFLLYVNHQVWYLECRSGLQFLEVFDLLVRCVGSGGSLLPKFRRSVSFCLKGSRFQRLFFIETRILDRNVHSCCRNANLWLAGRHTHTVHV